MNIGAFVPKFCTVGGSIKPIDLTISIPVSATGTVNTAVQSFTAHSIICNAPAEVVAMSMLGGAKGTAGGSPSVVNYVVTASFGGATSTINTAVVPTATSAERGSKASTSSATMGNLVITVTPVQPDVPLVSATTFTDSLRVTLQPR